MKSPLRISDFRVPEGKKVILGRWPTRIRKMYRDKNDYLEQLSEAREELSRLQNILYAHNRHALLIIFQAMDAAGKDSAIRHILSGVNPQGCRVHSFKAPSEEELSHDFLWRTNQRLPERGMIGIFNRSYYEEVLVVRVHPELLEKQRLPAELVDLRRIWEERYRDIVNLEDYLARNGTHIVKFYLHVSKEEQRKRFLARLDEPDKNWKFSPADLEVRERWGDYRRAYEECLSATSTKRAPWHVIPSDDKKTARLIMSRIIAETLGALKMQYPRLGRAHRKELQAIRKKLEGS